MNVVIDKDPVKSLVKVVVGGCGEMLADSRWWWETIEAIGDWVPAMVIPFVIRLFLLDGIGDIYDTYNIAS